MKKLLFCIPAFLLLSAFTKTEPRLRNDEALVVVIDHNGEENYSKVKLSSPLDVEIVKEGEQHAVLQKLAVATVTDKLDRLDPGLYTVIASSNDYLYNRLIYVSQ